MNGERATDTPKETARGHVVVEGTVQGVFFRASTRDMAQGLGLSGWVRNLPDGSVEAVFQGPRDLAEKAVAWCRRGPPSATVTACRVAWEPAADAPAPFEIRYR